MAGLEPYVTGDGGSEGDGCLSPPVLLSGEEGHQAKAAGSGGRWM